MKVHRNTLLLLACLVWSTVGFNILHIGVLAYAGCLSAVNILLSALVFTVFQLFFGKLVIRIPQELLATRRNDTFFSIF